MTENIKNNIFLKENNSPMNIEKMFIRNEVGKMLDKIALALMIIGGLNWGLVGIFQFDLVSWLFGGTDAMLSRAVYILVAISALWCITLLFRSDERLVRATDS